MKPLRWDDQEFAYFAVVEVDPRYHAALSELAYRPGPHGFERCFPIGTPLLDTAFENFSSFVETMVLQTAGELPVSWSGALARVSELLYEAEIGLCLVGSAALAVRGIEVSVRDIDFIIDETDISKVDQLLRHDLIEPTTEKEAWIARWFGRAFSGVRIEWVAGIREWVDSEQLSDFGPTAQSRLESVCWQGLPLRVPPLDLQLQVTRRRGLKERAGLIEAYLADRKQEP